MLKILLLFSVGFLLASCSSLQPYQRLYILAEKIEKKEVEMASQCLPISGVTPHFLQENQRPAD